MTEKGHSCWRKEQHAKNCFDETTKLQPITIHVRFYGIKCCLYCIKLYAIIIKYSMHSKSISPSSDQTSVCTSLHLNNESS